MRRSKITSIDTKINYSKNYSLVYICPCCGNENDLSISGKEINILLKPETELKIVCENCKKETILKLV